MNLTKQNNNQQHDLWSRKGITMEMAMIHIEIPTVFRKSIHLMHWGKENEIPTVFRKDLLDNFLNRHTDDNEIITDCTWCIHTDVFSEDFIEILDKGEQGLLEQSTMYSDGYKAGNDVVNGKGTFDIGHGETTVSRVSYNTIRLENTDGQIAEYNLRTRRFEHVDGNVTPFND